MAVIGWLFLVIIPVWLAILGVATVIANNFGGKTNAWPLLWFAASGFMFYWWWGAKPFVITLSGGGL